MGSLRSSTVLGALLGCSLLHAQGVVSPDPFYATREGDLSQPYTFTRPSRMQQIHGDLIGTARLISGLTFRRDGIRNGEPHVAVPGKTITLTVTLADAVPVAAATSTFAANVAGNATTVFSGTIATPASWAVPATTAPAPLDFRIPITPWPYSGNGAFLWDLDSTATSDDQRIELDAAQSGFPLFSWCSFEMLGSGCATANGTFELRGSGQNLGGLGQYTVAVEGFAAPSNAACTWVVGFTPLNGNVPGLCTGVWPDPVAGIATTSDASGGAAAHFALPSNPAWLGIPLEMQMFAADATQPMLPLAGTNGLRYRIEPMAPTFAACSVVSATSSSPTGTLLSSRAAIVLFD